MQPDLLVAPRTDFTDRDLPTAPVLAVEVLTPSTRLIDLTLKHSRFEEAGARSYWVIDPIEPTLTAWDLVDGRYVQVADVRGDEPYEASRPFPVTVVPAQLRD
jgi:Uma2 family endonuclease